MKTLIKVSCVDQSLRLTNTPKIASGGVEEDRLHVDFCPMWDGFAKVAVFYRDIKNPYRVALDAAGECLIPSVVLVDPGQLYFAVYGTKDGVTRTSEVMAYRVWEGAITGAAEAPPEPPASLVEQVLELLEGKAERTDLEAHTINQNNPHNVTSEQIGAVSRADLEAHTADQSNPHNVTLEQIGAAPADHSHDLSEMGFASADDLTAHTTNQNNPHGVTAAQVGAEPAKLSFASVSVAGNNWAADTTYADYPYRAMVALTGVTADMTAEVVFALEEAMSGDYAPVNETCAGGLYLYAAKLPEADITVPRILVWR